MDKAIIVKESLKEIDELLQEGWTVKSMCPLVSSVAISGGGIYDYGNKNIVEQGRALVILTDGVK